MNNADLFGDVSTAGVRERLQRLAAGEDDASQDVAKDARDAADMLGKYAAGLDGRVANEASIAKQAQGELDSVVRWGDCAIG